MPLTPKERERIVEEEKLRFETRQGLMREQCGQHRPRRFLWWIAAIALAGALYCHFSCGGGSCRWGHGGMMEGKKCPYSMMEKDGGVEPGQPLPPKK